MQQWILSITFDEMEQKEEQNKDINNLLAL